MTLLPIVLCMVFFAGCGGKAPVNDNSDSPIGDIERDVIFEGITKAGTSEWLDGDKEDAEEVIAVADLILEAIETGQLSTPEQVDDYVRDLIMATDLQPATKQLGITFTDYIRRSYLARIESGQLDPSVTAPIGTIVTWVREAASDTVKYGTVRDYGAEEVPQEQAEKYELNTTQTIWILRVLMFWLWWSDDGGTASYSAPSEEPLDLSLGGWIFDKRTREAYPLFGESKDPEPETVYVKVKGDPTGGIYPSQPLPAGLE